MPGGFIVNPLAEAAPSTPYVPSCSYSQLWQGLLSLLLFELEPSFNV